MRKFLFDLDGTITKIETLPILAAELNLADEIKIITDLTLQGKISFEKSFRLRWLVLKNIPIKKIHEIMATVELDKNISDFIRDNKNICAIVTGNLDCWIEPIAEKLGCEIFCSESRNNELTKILDKAETVREIKKFADKIISVGDSYNDIKMFRESDISVAYGGVHEIPDIVKNSADYVIHDSKTLCELLKNFL